MPTLLDRPSDEVLALLGVVARSFHEAERQWPTWQYIAWAADQEGINAEEIFLSMPRWKGGHSYLASHFGSPRPTPDSIIHMTALGMHHVGDLLCSQLLDALLGTIRGVEQFQRATKPSPLHVQFYSLDSANTLNLTLTHSGVPLSAELLMSILAEEPPTRTGLSGKKDQWHWDLRDVQLSRFRGVTDGAMYLARLEALVSSPSKRSSDSDLPRAAVPEALDHLDLAWHKAYRKELVSIRKAMMPAELTLPVMNEEEFQSRCSAMSSILNGFRTAVKKDDAPDGKAVPSMLGLEQHLRKTLEQPERALAAVRVLRGVIAVRLGHQHREQKGRDADAEKARVALGLVNFENDWSGAWEHLRHQIVDALRALRDELPE